MQVCENAKIQKHLFKAFKLFPNLFIGLFKKIYKIVSLPKPGFKTRADINIEIARDHKKNIFNMMLGEYQMLERCS